MGIGVLNTTVGDSLTLNGAIKQVVGAALGITKVGLGTLILDNNANTYNGVTTVSAGTLRIQQGGRWARRPTAPWSRPARPSSWTAA